MTGGMKVQDLIHAGKQAGVQGVSAQDYMARYNKSNE